MPCRSTPNLVAWTIAQTGDVTVLLQGQPGCGKSRTVEAFARHMNRNIYTLIGSIREPCDIGGYPFAVQNEPPYMAVMPPKWAHDCMHGQWVLFFDELTTCPPAVQAAMLGVIAENRVGDIFLPTDGRVWKLAACNPPDCAANGHELEPPLANRLAHLSWETDKVAWKRGMASGLKFPAPSFVPLPQNWRTYIDGNVARIAAFHDYLPDRLERFPKERAKQSGPWPSLRSWTNAGICAAALEAIDAEPLLRYQAMSACVGDEVINEFQTWEASLDLPNPEAWITKALDARKAGQKLTLDLPDRCDQIMVTLGAVVERVKNHDLADNGKPLEDRWLAAVDCFACVFDTWAEPAIAAAGPLYFCAPHGAAILKAPPDFSAKVVEIHKNVMAA